jgi:hypothetical protein
VAKGAEWWGFDPWQRYSLSHCFPFDRYWEREQWLREIKADRPPGDVNDPCTHTLTVLSRYKDGSYLTYNFIWFLHSFCA